MSNQTPVYFWTKANLFLVVTEWSHFANFCASPNCTNSTFLKCLNQISWLSASLSMRDGHFCRFSDNEWTWGDNNDDVIAQCWDDDDKDDVGGRWKEMDFSELSCLFSQPRPSRQPGLTTIAKRLWIEWGGDESGWWADSDDEDILFQNWRPKNVSRNNWNNLLRSVQKISSRC